MRDGESVRDGRSASRGAAAREMAPSGRVFRRRVWPGSDPMRAGDGSERGQSARGKG